MRVLIVDEDPQHHALVAAALYRLECEIRYEQALKGALVRHRPDLVLLSADAEHADVPAMCQEIRASSAVPLLLYGFRGAEARERARGLRAGADDYLPLPLDADEIVARIGAVMRRCAADLHLDPTGQSVRVHGGKPVRLSPTEYRLLDYMVRARGRPLPPGRILSDLWQEANDDRGHRTRLAVYIHRLRNKIERDPQRPRRLLSLRDGHYMLAPVAGLPAARAREPAALGDVERSRGERR